MLVTTCRKWRPVRITTSRWRKTRALRAQPARFWLCSKMNVAEIARCWAASALRRLRWRTRAKCWALLVLALTSAPTPPPGFVYLPTAARKR